MQPNYNEDTEWNDILRQKGIIPEINKTELDDIIDQVIAERDPLDSLDLDDLDELEDEQDERVLLKYRQARIKEMQLLASKAIYGSITQFSRSEYNSVVTEASRLNNPSYVVVLLFNDSVPASRLFQHHLEFVAKSHPTVKFLKIVADQCIQNYPNRNVPTLIIYGHGEIVVQLVGIESLGGMNVNAAAIEFLLLSHGVLENCDLDRARGDSKIRDEDEEDD